MIHAGQNRNQDIFIAMELATCGPRKGRMGALNSSRVQAKSRATDREGLDPERAEWHRVTDKQKIRHEPTLQC